MSWPQGRGRASTRRSRPAAAARWSPPGITETESPGCGRSTSVGAAVGGVTMSDLSGSSGRDPLGRLADEFLERRRRGEGVSPAEYARHHPGWAEQILDLFPALEVMEGLKPASADRTDSFDDG